MIETEADIVRGIYSANFMRATLDRPYDEVSTASSTVVISYSTSSSTMWDTRICALPASANSCWKGLGARSYGARS